MGKEVGGGRRLKPGHSAALITGGAQGIGKAIAQRFLREGMGVAIADIDAEAGEETATELSRLGETLFVRADVAIERHVRGMIRKTLLRFGRLDVLINNAGISRNKPIAKLALADWNRVIAVNLTGTFLCSKHAAPHLAKAGGAIVNIASTRAVMTEPDTEAYSASKGGIVALTHSLAISLGPRVRVNCILPGWIEVGEWRKAGARWTPHHSDADRRQHPAGRVGRPEDIAALAFFLASPEASFITGASFIADGGMTRKMIYV